VLGGYHILIQRNKGGGIIAKQANILIVSPSLYQFDTRVPFQNLKRDISLLLKIP
jgi:hypothetical protein